MFIGGKIHSPQELAFVATLFLIIPILTYFFSSHRALIVRVFGPSTKRAEVERQSPQDDAWRKGMRFMAALQLLLPLAMYIAAIVWHYRR